MIETLHDAFVLVGGMLVGAGIAGLVLGVRAATAYARGKQDTLDSIFRTPNTPTPIRRPNRDPNRPHP